MNRRGKRTWNATLPKPGHVRLAVNPSCFKFTWLTRVTGMLFIQLPATPGLRSSGMIILRLGEQGAKNDSFDHHACTTLRSLN
ncbi:hypothetical protein VTO73DRAFT_15402 [Trametes versicolor]